MSSIQDDASKGAAVIEKDPIPWYAEGWYKPGVVIGLVAIAAFGVAPWAGDNASRMGGSATALFFIGALITIVYAFKAEDYKITEEKVKEAERNVRHEWSQEQSYEHCKEHCQCIYDRNRRYQERMRKQAIES